MKNRGKLDDTLAAMFSNIDYRSDYLFYAHMIGQCSIKIDEDLPAPAGVAFQRDHYNLYINPTEFDKFTLVERLAVLKHEMLHILYGHLDRMEDRVHMPWNFSTDCALNQHINPEHLPKQGVLPDNLGKMLGTDVPYNQSAEFYYELIKEQIENNQDENGSPQDGDDEAGDNPKLMDSHETWQESTGDTDLQKDITKKMIEKSQAETIKSKGKVPSECSEWLEMFTRKSEVNWKKVLRGIVGNKRVGKRSTIMRQDRRFPKREDLRGKTKDRLFSLLVVADVSGSMTDEGVIGTLAEVQHICDITKTAVDLIQVDSEAFPPEKLSKNTKLIERKGFGGTMLHPALDMANKHNVKYDAVVVLTDGGIWAEDIERFLELNKKVIWLVSADGYILNEMIQGKMQAFQLKN
jgi:predicted metal-dependent peptidase